MALVVAAASGWSSPELANVVNTAPGPGATVTVHADVLGPFPWTDIFTARLFYSTDNQATWTELTMSPVGRPGYDSTFGASFAIPGSGTVWYYVRAKDTFGYATQSPRNSANAWPAPVNLIAEMADERAGDATNNPDGPFLDLTGIRMGYSATHFYVRLTNDDDQWPVRRTIIGPWYLYAAGFRNPDAPQDTFTFALAYGNVLGIYTPGLYAINGYTSDFERIGDIDYQIAGNVLSMRCLITDLTSHPKFGPWPNSSGYLRAARGDTRSVDINQNNTLHDTTNQSRWYVDRTPAFLIGRNDPPLLSRPGVVPTSGTPETDFWFNVRYTDPDTNLPVLCAVVVDQDTFELVPAHHRYAAGVTFDTTLSGFGPGWHSVRFTADDGMAVATADADSFYVTGVALADDRTPQLGDRALAAAPSLFRSQVDFTTASPAATIEVFGPAGRILRRLRTTLGRVRWDGKDDTGRRLPAGVYFCQLVGGVGDRLRLVRLDR